MRFLRATEVFLNHVTDHAARRKAITLVSLDFIEECSYGLYDFNIPVDLLVLHTYTSSVMF